MVVMSEASMRVVWWTVNVVLAVEEVTSPNNAFNLNLSNLPNNTSRRLLSMDCTSSFALVGLRLFFGSLFVILCTHPKAKSKLFIAHHGRSHRMLGGAHLLWLVFGITFVVQPDDGHYNSFDWQMKCIAYDVVLGLLGVATTLSAAHNFPHRRVVNRPGESGTLSESAIVTQHEMIEHSFYQGLNVWQALYLHGITWIGENALMNSTVGRFVALWFVTLPWAIRSWFPVNSFSANWTTSGERDNTMSKKRGSGKRDECIQVGTIKDTTSLPTINRMYQIKKWQYVFYKHLILHGLNISMAFPRQSNDGNVIKTLPTFSIWRIFWISLNASFVMEFFLQSLVKRGVLTQFSMIVLQWILMASSSLAAIGAVLGRVRVEAAAISLLLNFVNRRHDIVNTLCTGGILVLVSKIALT
jgi:hypothetical protein